jgi:hypothetical protein
MRIAVGCCCRRVCAPSPTGLLTWAYSCNLACTQDRGSGGGAGGDGHGHFCCGVGVLREGAGDAGGDGAGDVGGWVQSSLLCEMSLLGGCGLGFGVVRETGPGEREGSIQNAH